jgi:DsbC/DsbD-like thiol-disulfide interchange protein
MTLTGKTLPRTVAALAVVLLAAPWATGQAIVSSGESFIEARLVPGRAEPDGTRVAGLVIELAPEWKTYWRSPGAAGIPPGFDWSKSANLAAAEVLWPRPDVFESFGIATLGYAEKVVFPVRLTPADPARPIAVRLGLSLGVCRDLCVLEETELSADIAPGAPEEGAGLVAAAEASVPRPAAALGLTEAVCRIEGTGAKRRFGATLVFDRPLEDARVLLEGPDLVWFNDVRTEAGPGTGRLRVGAEVSLLDESAWLGRSDIRMTVLAADFAADIRGCAAPQG